MRNRHRAAFYAPLHRGTASEDWGDDDTHRWRRYAADEPANLQRRGGGITTGREGAEMMEGDAELYVASAVPVERQHGVVVTGPSGGRFVVLNVRAGEGRWRTQLALKETAEEIDVDADVGGDPPPPEEPEEPEPG